MFSCDIDVSLYISHERIISGISLKDNTAPVAQSMHSVTQYYLGS